MDYFLSIFLQNHHRHPRFSYIISSQLILVFQVDNLIQVFFVYQPFDLIQVFQYF